MTFAFLIMGSLFDSQADRAKIHNGVSRIIGAQILKMPAKPQESFMKTGYTA